MFASVKQNTPTVSYVKGQHIFSILFTFQANLIYIFDDKNPKSGPGLDIWMVIKRL